MIRIKDVLSVLEEAFPPLLAETWDHSGLQVGDPNATCTGVLVAVEATESTVEECARKGYNLLVTHHPILFHPLYRITPTTYQERTIALALCKGITIYAAHTNADNAWDGLNRMLLPYFDVQKTEALEEVTERVSKLSVMVPPENADSLKNALFTAGAGRIGQYEKCAYTFVGEGQFKPLSGANPYIGKEGSISKVTEACVSVLVPNERLGIVLAALREAHPYEEPAYDVIPLKNGRSDAASGLIATLQQPITEDEALERIASIEQVKSVSHSLPLGRSVQRIAVVTGSGGSFMNKAIARGADLLLTGEARYNDFLDAQGRILLVTVGHWESEQPARALFHRVITQKIPNFAVETAETDINPIQYKR